MPATAVAAWNSSSGPVQPGGGVTARGSNDRLIVTRFWTGVLPASSMGAAAAAAMAAAAAAAAGALVGVAKDGFRCC